MPVAKIANTPAQASAQSGTTHQSFTVSSTAGTLETLGSFTFDSETKHALVQVNGGGARVTFDGATDPVAATSGFLIVDGRECYWPIKLAENAIIIADSGDVTVELQELNYKG